MAFFDKEETKGILIIFFLLGISTYFGFAASYRRSRDVQRNLDVSAIATGIHLYKIDFGAYPLSSEDGKIVACRGPQTKTKKGENDKAVYRDGATKPILENLVSCEWGESKLLDINDINYPNYLTRIPDDPMPNKYYYHYYSDGNVFRIYGHFEGKTQKELDKNIARLNISCGEGICNFGKASSGVDLTNPLP